MLQDNKDERKRLFGKAQLGFGMGLWLSQKGIDYVLAPKRGAFNCINPEIASTVTAKGQNNWIGTFISPDIESVQHETRLGGATPTVIYLKNGEVWEYDGKAYIQK